jgi:uncharacterized membrane protein
MEGPAKALVRTYAAGGVAWMALCLVVGLGATTVGAVPGAVMIGALPLLTLAGFLGLYLRSHFRALAMAATGAPPPSASVLLPAGQVSPALPWLAIAVGVTCGLVALWYATVHYDALPATVPTHFGVSGAPDDWRPKSVFTVMLLPLLTLVLGIGLGVTALLTARAKRAIRYPAAAVSAEAQFRFRQAMTRYLSVVAMVVPGLLLTLSVGAVDVGLGLAPVLPGMHWVFGVGLGVLAIGGTFYIAMRYGQGGARLERSAGTAPLTNGLADNRHWLLGSFYVNHDDPSIMVERRFGLGYTFNFGNWKAVTYFVLFMGVLMTIVVVALVTN